MPVKEISKGSRFGRLTVDGNYELRKSGNSKVAFYQCNCDCGNSVWVRGTNLRYGSTKSCGCYGKEQRIKNTTKHNHSDTRLYRIWNNMRTRCNKDYVKSFVNYGERGISVCKEWDNTEDGFQNFYDWSMENGYSDNLTIDRIDNNKGYFPENCRWVTQYIQNRNKRVNRYYNVDGNKMILTDIATKNNISPKTLQGRLDAGYTISEALEKEFPKKRLIFYKGEFITPKEFSAITGINYNTIMTRMTKGYTKAEDLIVQDRNVFSRKEVKKYDLDGNYIETYQSASEAARKNNCATSGVIDCCNGKKNRVKEWIFKYSCQKEITITEVN